MRSGYVLTYDPQWDENKQDENKKAAGDIHGTAHKKKGTTLQRGSFLY